MIGGIVNQASNIRTTSGCDITMEYFLSVYPQFGTPDIPETFLETVLAEANASIACARWHSRRPLAVCLYVAHFATLYLRTLTDANASPASIARAGDGAGNVTSKSVGGVSVSYGSSEGTSDLVGYGSWKDTVFGQQLASMARVVGSGMMVVR